MIDRIPRRLRVAFTRTDSTRREETSSASYGRPEVDFVAYGEDCVLSGRTILDGDRLSDMLNDNDEYVLNGVTVERFDGGDPMTVDEFVIGRDDMLIVHASGPRGNIGRRRRTSQQHIAIQIGRYQVRGFYHALPGTDPGVAIRRRKPMVPLTNVRIVYVVAGETREVQADTIIFNRDLIDWLEAVEPDRAEFPAGPERVTANGAVAKRAVAKRAVAKSS